MLNELLTSQMRAAHWLPWRVLERSGSLFRIVMIVGALHLNTSDVLLYVHTWYHELLLSKPYPDSFHRTQINFPAIVLDR